MLVGPAGTFSRLQLQHCHTNSFPGQVSTALQLLAQAALTKMDFAHYNRGTFLTQEAAMGLSASSIMLGLLFLGFSYFWFVIGIYGIIESSIKNRSRAQYSMVWWALIFPVGSCCYSSLLIEVYVNKNTGTLDTAWQSLADSMDSPTFRVLTTGLFIILVICYFGNWFFTIKGVIRGPLFFGKTKEEMREMNEKERKSD